MDKHLVFSKADAITKTLPAQYDYVGLYSELCVRLLARSRHVGISAKPNGYDFLLIKIFMRVIILLI